MELVRKVKREDFYKAYYTALNGVLKLTKVELNVLSELSKLYSEGNTLIKQNRRNIANKLEMSIFNFNNYLSILKDKKMISINNSDFKINPNIYIRDDKSEYKLNFKFQIYD